jgi:murein L,D-transpeptidase YcbB/YkuD
MRLSSSSRLFRAAAASLLIAGGAAALPACTSRDVSAPVSGAPGSFNAAQVDVMLHTLADAPSHGFQPGAFGGPRLAERVRSGDRAAQAELRRAVLAYAAALHGLAIPKKAYDPAWGERAPAYDAEAEFTRAAKNGRLQAWLENLPPDLPQYQALRTAYADYGRIVRSGGWAPLPVTDDLTEGARGPQVAALRDRLAVEDPKAAKAEAADVFDPGLAEAVKRAQLRYGLRPTGVADAHLRAALDVPAQARLAQIRANLERLRWLPRERPATRIEVNSAAGEVHVYRDGEIVLSMLAASGKPGDETPMLASSVDQVVLNPAWNVPDQIAENELLPKGEAYLQSHGFVVNPPGEGVMLTQAPGPQNALGQVKFLFDNPFAVYLHDTPSRAAFTQVQRSVSHGCVRLAQAKALAHLLLESEPGWSGQRIDAVLAGDQTTTVKLKTPVPVFIGYFTAYPTSLGFAFRPDVYGWDAEVLRRLDAETAGRA